MSQLVSRDYVMQEHAHFAAESGCRPALETLCTTVALPACLSRSSGVLLICSLPGQACREPVPTRRRLGGGRAGEAAGQAHMFVQGPYAAWLLGTKQLRSAGACLLGHRSGIVSQVRCGSCPQLQYLSSDALRLCVRVDIRQRVLAECWQPQGDVTLGPHSWGSQANYALQVSSLQGQADMH